MYFNFEIGNSDSEEEDVEDVDPGLVDQRANSSTSLHSMDDDLQAQPSQTSNGVKWQAQESHQNPGPLKKILSNFKSCCIF